MISIEIIKLAFGFGSEDPPGETDGLQGKGNIV
ncbi:hypothetical protein ES705_31930 [subsurface metagenome]